jgi:hypothetical protein
VRHNPLFPFSPPPPPPPHTFSFLLSPPPLLGWLKLIADEQEREKEFFF